MSDPSSPETQRRLVLPSGRPMDADDASERSLTFIGNATVLIRYAGLSIMTDPNFVHRHEQVDIGYGLRATRLTDPALELADLPPVDLVVLSHFHGDHFDQVAERELDRALPIVTTEEARRALEERGFEQVHSLARWQDLHVERGDARLRITATPGRHGPPVVSVALPDVMGTVLDFQDGSGGPGLRLYISGDTLMYGDLEDIPERFPDIDLALLHLGGTRVLGMLVTMDAEQGLALVRLVAPRVSIPIHYADYDVFTSPLSDFRDLIDEAGLSDRVRYLAPGERYALPG